MPDTCSFLGSWPTRWSTDCKTADHGSPVLGPLGFRCPSPLDLASSTQGPSFRPTLPCPAATAAGVSVLTGGHNGNRQSEGIGNGVVAPTVVEVSESEGDASQPEVQPIAVGVSGLTRLQEDSLKPGAWNALTVLRPACLIQHIATLPGLVSCAATLDGCTLLPADFALAQGQVVWLWVPKFEPGFSRGLLNPRFSALRTPRRYASLACPLLPVGPSSSVRGSTLRMTRLHLPSDV